MTPKQQREELSKAYVSTVAARCGYKIGTWTQDDECIDTTIGAPGFVGRGTIGDPKVDLQLKCTSDQKHLLGDGDVSWALKLEHFEQLARRAQCPKLLVVLVLPENDASWVSHSANELILRRCAWWVRMTGMPRPLVTAKQDHVTVRLPSLQLFSPSALQTIMKAISEGRMP